MPFDEDGNLIKPPKKLDLVVQKPRPILVPKLKLEDSKIKKSDNNIENNKQESNTIWKLFLK